MPDNKTTKTVDIDTSGPGVEIELEVKQPETNEVEVSNDKNDKDGIKSIDTSAKSNEQVDVQTSKQEKEIKDQGTELEDNIGNKKELEDYSESVKKRIAKLTKKMREAERQREAAVEYARTIQSERDSLAGKLNKLDSGFVTEMENRIKSSMEAAVAKLAKARQSEDLNAEVAAQTEISRLGYEEARLLEIKAKQKKDQEEKEVRVKKSEPAVEQGIQQPQIMPDPKAQNWAEKNTWFGQDEAMTYTAFSLHKKLVEEEGYDPQTDEYYAEIDKRIRLDFPHKFGNATTTNTVKPTQTVASATRTSKTGNRKTVKLTPSQVAIAKKLGVPLEEYAKHLTAKEV